MARARLMIESAEGAGHELELRAEASIGRAPDNLIRVDDPLVSQYHAVLERRGDAFWLSDLGSTNGTTVNGDPVAGERRLATGDAISIGGVVAMTFYSDEDRPQPWGHPSLDRAESSSDAISEVFDSSPEPLQADPPARASGVMVLAAVVAGIAIAAGAVLLAVGLVGEPGGAVRVLSPESGSTIRGPQKIRVEAENSKEIDEVIYLLDGIAFTRADYPPFEAVLDPAQLETKVRNLDSGNHVLTVIVQDKEGNNIPQPDSILLAFEVVPARDEPGDVKRQGDEPARGTAAGSAQAGPPDIASLARNLAATISGKSWYDFDAQFAEEIRRRTDAYRVGVMDDASRHRRQIGSAFNSKGLPVAVGFVLALSESRFKEGNAPSPDLLGMWLVPKQIALEQGYITPDEPASALNDVKRSSEIAASYINDLINAFGGTDQFMYAIACYGKPLGQAAKMRARLEEVDPDATDRRNFWRMVKAGVVPRDGAERVAKFFAAGIVGENPQAFGLSSRPLSSLY